MRADAIPWKRLSPNVRKKTAGGTLSVTMTMDLANAGFAFEPDWYWRIVEIVEGDGTFGAAAS